MREKSGFLYTIVFPGLAALEKYQQLKKPQVKQHENCLVWI